jgi:alkanesulfonate monooxygenase SsuD/methylene tetrahydromethanopterin reductase-like flavin-dependent oxidoreductase (luciferase family)
MKFGLLYELGSPDGSPAAVRRVYENALEQIRVADEVGFDYVWCVEHHFSLPLSMSIAPEVFLTAAAMQTKRIRLGMGIAVCVPPINHPVRIAERAAVLDLLSGGRVDVGTGRAGSWSELGGFAAEPHTTKQSWDEYVRAIPKMWTQPTFSHDGEFFKMPERAVVPKPLQSPHPPLWVAVTSNGTEIDAAERGLGSFGLSMGSYEAQEKKIKNYRNIIRNCDPVGSFVNEQVHTVNFLLCDEDGRKAARTGRRLLDTFNYATSHGVPIKEVYSSPTYQIGGFLPTLRQEALGPSDDSGIPPGLAIGDPDRIINIIKKWEEIGVDGLNFVVQAIESVPQEDVLNSLRTFARQVMPKFKVKEQVLSEAAR